MRLDRETARDLPDELALPLAGGAPWWYWLGGRPSIDLVNTLRERWRRRVETLVTPADLGLWLARAGLVPSAPTVTPARLREARELREAIDACLRTTLAGEPAPPAAVATIDGLLAHVGARPQLVVGGDGAPVLGALAPADPARSALAEIALDAARMLGTPAEAARIRVCASETCSARFYDRSPAGRRRWCSMALCGNEAKARRHRERARSGTDAAGTGARSGGAGSGAVARSTAA